MLKMVSYLIFWVLGSGESTYFNRTHFIEWKPSSQKRPRKEERAYHVSSVVQIQSIVKYLPSPLFRWLFILFLRTGKLAKGASNRIITSVDKTKRLCYLYSPWLPFLFLFQFLGTGIITKWPMLQLLLQIVKHLIVIHSKVLNNYLMLEISS